MGTATLSFLPDPKVAITDRRRTTTNQNRKLLGIKGQQKPGKRGAESGETNFVAINAAIRGAASVRKPGGRGNGKD